MRWLRLFGFALLAACSSWGCERFTKTGAAPSASSSAAAVAPGAAHAMATDPLSSPSAFELVAQGSGLSLLWASARTGPGWLEQGALARDGSLSAPARRLSLPARSLGKVTDLAATRLGDDLALAWVEQGHDEARAAATFLVGEAPPQVLDLGPAALSAASARGNLVLAAEPEQGRALVLWRGLKAPCVEAETAPCVGFTFRRLRPGAAETNGMPLAVPVPCAQHSALLAVASGRFFYGVCTREGAEPVTTLFRIQYEPQYARADPLLKGCLPLGTIDVAGQPWLVGDCHGKRRALRLSDDKEPEQADLDALHISCTSEHAELRQAGFALTLREPRAGLEVVLPASLAPTGARAGWSGKSLVVASIVAGRLETRAWACQGSSLQPL